MSKVWGNIGAWAEDAERAEAEEAAAAAASASAAPVQSFPSLKEAVSSNKGKKKTKMTLQEFTMAGSGAGSGTGAKGLTHEEMMRLPTGPKERSAEEMQYGRLGGGFSSYGGGRTGGGPRMRDREADGDRRYYGGFDDDRRGPVNRSSEYDQPSRADEVDNWTMTKKTPSFDGNSRPNRYSSLGGSGGGSAGGGGFSRADEIDNWTVNKKPVPPPVRSSNFGSGFRNSGGPEQPDRWSRGVNLDREPVTERQRLVLDPPKGESSIEAVSRSNKPNPFGNARPREEILSEKGFDWRKTDLELDAKRTSSRPTSSHSNSRPGSAQSGSSVEVSGALQGLEKARPKVNPFGDAKPREVLLQEKGVDYRKIDLELERKRLGRAGRREFDQIVKLISRTPPPPVFQTYQRRSRHQSGVAQTQPNQPPPAPQNQPTTAPENQPTTAPQNQPTTTPPVQPTTTAQNSTPLPRQRPSGLRPQPKQTQRYSPTSLHTSSSPAEPPSFAIANTDPNWRAAMASEFSALLRNHTWSLVPRVPNSNVIGCKWVYKLKDDQHGNLTRYKARLVAKGFKQEPGIDYHETFSPVIKSTTIRVVLSLAVAQKWPLRQLDVQNAFLHGDLDETLYLQQPPGFVDPEKPDHVCLLHKALYGLKQAPRAWFHRLSTALQNLGFIGSKTDPSLFIYSSQGTLLYMLVYVDDIILTGNNPEAINRVVHNLSKTFAVKDMGALSYFLGIEITPRGSDVLFSQRKYINDLLARTNLTKAKPVPSPITTSANLALGDSPEFDDPVKYRQVVGALQYVTISRPDVTYAVNKVCQFMHAPTNNHWSAVKRILRYLRGTSDYGLLFKHNSGTLLHAYTDSDFHSLSAFSDADWAGCPDDRRSTGGYAIYLGSNLVSWSARKQRTVSRSSTEAEYKALADTVAELTWLQTLLKELRVSTTSAPNLWCDNLGATYLSANPVFHARTKHVEVDFHFVREKVAKKELSVKFISTKDQIADVFTKPLSSQRFLDLRSKLQIVEFPIILFWPETEAEKNLKEEIYNLKMDVKKGFNENQSLDDTILEKERELEQLTRELDDKLRFGQKTIERPGSGAGRMGSGFQERPGSGSERGGFHDRPPSQSGSFDESRSVDFSDRPRSRGDFGMRPSDDRRGFGGGRDNRGYLGNREIGRSNSRDRW
ncbi:hypothetical protein QVD17_31549 [Tagetes erecta]|uniref:Reverse transcriptase Ty1/copia-type domain-containing protein n=1 Tax=Tagetes erecta TaxID=13708 RepID=A0AAD8K5T7_TARER|nr:hypothetical protein QVD17_31549 [Tagetes erecta]